MNKVAIDCHSKVIYFCAMLIFVVMFSHMDNTSAGDAMKLSESDSGKTKEISVGDALEITVPGNATTGYVWGVSAYDSNILKLASAKFHAEAGAMGAGGTEIITFRAVAEGKSEVKLIFHRPFEHNVTPIKTFAAMIIVKK